MRRFTVTAGTACLVALLVSTPSTAEELRYTFTADFVNLSSTPEPGSDVDMAAVYASVSGTLSYNTAAGIINTAPDGTFVRYATGSIVLDQFDWAAVYDFNVAVSNDRDTGFRQFDNLTWTGIGQGGGRQDSISLSLDDPTQSALSGTALPDHTFALADFTIAAFVMNDVLPSGFVSQIRFDLTSLEPASGDADGDGVSDSDDICENTVIPEAAPTSGRLGNGRHAMTEPGTIDFTSGKAGNFDYTIEDTGGCSCSQIIDLLDLGNGQLRNGCSNSTMENWVSGL